jgi:signal transduction histidine kinase
MSKYLLLWLVAILSISTTSYAQEETNVPWFENLFLATKLNSPLEQQLVSAKNKLKEAKDKGQGKEEVKATIELGSLYFTQLNDYEKAMDWFIRSLVVEDSLQLNQERVFTYLAMARVFEVVGYHSKSIAFLVQAVNLNEKENNPELLTFILNETGRANAAYGDIDEALENFELALDYARKLKQPDREADALFFRGNLLSKKGNYKDALAQHKEALQIRRVLGDRDKEGKSLTEIGELYRQMKNEDRALANHVAALAIRKSLADERGLAETYNNIGSLYFRTKDFKRSISNLGLALEAGRKAQDQDQLKTSYDYLSQSYKALKDYKRSLEYREQFASMQEFSQTERNERHLLERQSLYLIDKKELQITNLEKDRQQRELVIEAQRKEKRNLMYVISLGAVILALILFLYFLMRRTSRKLKELNATKDKLFSIIGHDLKGPLNSLTSFSSLLLNHADKLTKEEIKMLSADLDKSLKNLMALLENLLEWSRSQTGSIDFKAERFDINAVVVENLELLKSIADNKKIQLRNKAQGEIFVLAHRYSINTVVRNLLSNAIKFTKEGGLITINIALGKVVTLAVQDTGVGMTPATLQSLFELGSKTSTLGTAKEKGTGLGLILCKDFVEKNGGTIHVESTEGVGSKFYFTVPKG